MAWTLLVAGFCFYIGSGNAPDSTRTDLVALFVFTNVTEWLRPISGTLGASGAASETIARGKVRPFWPENKDAKT